MKIALFYNKESESTTGAYLEKAMRQAGIDYTHFWTHDAHHAPRLFDLYFRIDHGDYKDDIPFDLHPSVFYAIDTHLPKPYKKIKRQVAHYDIVFCAQKSGARRLAKETGIDVQWVPLACDPAIHKKIATKKNYDIGFVGRDAAKFARGRQLDTLRKKYPASFIGTADFTRLGEIYSASRIGFNSSIINDINMRIFEVMAAGCFLLTNEIRDNGFEDLFEAGKHLVTYRSDRDLAALIDYYLSHEVQREAIAACGHELVINRHTYRHRLQTMLNYIAFKFGTNFNILRI